MTVDLSTPVASTPGNDPANNATRLLTALHRRGGAATRAELTTQLDCGRSAVSYALADLVERGLVTVDEHPPPASPTGVRAGAGTTSGRGRPSHLVTVAPTSPIAIAVHLRVDTLDVAAFELGGRKLRHAREPVEPSPGLELTMHRIGRLARRIADEQSRPCIGVGVALPSPIRATDGYALAPRHMNWPGVPARDLIAAEFADTAGLAHIAGLAETTALAGIPVHIGNDANVAALAEYLHGAGKDARNMLFVTTEHVGIGGGLITSGRLFTGASGYAMEVGHTVANPGGEPCTCGARGCLETEADSRALLRAATRPDSPTTGIEDRARAVLADAAAHDPIARKAADTVAARVGSGLAVLVNLLDPDRIVLGGLLSRVLAIAPAPLTDALHERSFLERAVPVPVVPAQLPAPALSGAAELALAPLLA